MSNIVIIGGGTAGWLTALYVQKKFPQHNITVVASSKIGILGAGEGSTPQFNEFLKLVDIPIADLLKHTGATVKNGIKFTNWNGDGEFYYHGFKDHPSVDPTHEKVLDPLKISPLYLDKIAKNENLDQYDFTSFISENQRVKYSKDTQEKFGESSLHFNARELAKYFETVGVSRGVTVVDDEVSNIVADSDMNITSFALSSGATLDADFVFDCTGFQRMIIGKFYKSQWNTYKHSLPVNRAIPFFIENPTDNLPPYTESIAMKYGWMWKIPVQGRYGCGYVFNKELVSDEDAQKEIEEYLGHKINPPTVFNFEPGAFEHVWIKNCLAIGLSSGFVEPLEATSIWVQIQSLEFFGDKFEEYLQGNPLAVEYVNVNVKRMNDVILNFIYLHYITKRTDTEFWTNFTADNIVPQGIDYLNKYVKSATIDRYFFDVLLSKMQYIAFGEQSWYAVGAGVRIFKPEIAKKEFDSLVEDSNYYESLKQSHLASMQAKSELLMTHWEYIRHETAN